MGMNRNNISEKNNPTFDITAMNHLVQKVINQRHSSKFDILFRWKERIQSHLVWTNCGRSHMGT
jgi:hypothetical protein